MGKKHDQMPALKVMKEKAGKPTEHGRAGKRQTCKSQTLGNIKKDAPRSKPGFTLYTEADGSTRSTKTKTAPKRPHSARNKSKEQETEVVTQMQVQADRMRAAQASGIVIPTGDEETFEDPTLVASFDLPDVSTPFNKRLVSSTPDPERLVEAELMEQQGFAAACSNSVSHYQPGPTSPQMIPERDIPKTSAEVSPIEQSKQQHNQLQHQCKVHKQTTQHQNTLWQHHPHQYMQNMPVIQKLAPTGVTQVTGEAGSSATHQEPKRDVVESQHVTVTKAEWVKDSDQLCSTVGTETRTPRQESARENINSSKYRSFGVTSSAPTEAYTSHHLASSTQTDKAGGKGTSYSNMSSQPLPVDHVTVSSQSVSHSALSHNLPAPDQYGFYASSKQPTQVVRDIAGNLETRSSGFEALKKKQPLSYQKEAGSIISQPGLSPFSSKSVIKKDSEMKSAMPVSLPKASTSIQNTVQGKSGLSSQSVKQDVVRKVALKSTALKGKRVAKSSLDQRGEDVPPNVEAVDLSIKLLPSIQPGLSGLTVADKQATNSAKANPNKYAMSSGMDDSADSCDIEVSNVTGDRRHYNDERRNDSDERRNDSEEKRNHSDVSQQEVNTENHAGQELNRDPNDVDNRGTPASEAKNLSQVIEMLKHDAFYDNKRLNIADESRDDESTVVGDDSDVTVKEKMDVSSGDQNYSEGRQNLEELINYYLPKEEKSVSNVNNSNSVERQETGGILPGTFDDVDVEGKQEDNEELTEKNINQNYLSEEDDDSSVTNTSARPRNLQYLENMADPTLRDIACRLALKATALRDVELRDLIDDMIFHTDAALGHEDARYQSSQMFFAEENGKLKKRIQSVNRQLEAKERQERMGNNVLSISNNDVLHLERKNMYLRQEKDKLDSQVTTLLEEKAKWLITQQDLVRTISLKDHEILKLEEKHHEEKTALHKSLDQVAKNSENVHYKLSVADREISNLEQRLKCKDLDIGDLKKKLQEAEVELEACGASLYKKEQEMIRLQELVDTLKIGVDHVLHAFESSASHETATTQQKQGIDNLRQMVHPEEYSVSGSTTSDATTPVPMEARTVRIREPQDSQHPMTTSQWNQRQQRGVGSSSHGFQPLYHRSTHSHSPDSPQATRQAFHQSRHHQHHGEKPEGSHSRLTQQRLEEHNRRLSPVDRTLWRSLDTEPVTPHIMGEEPYYSDSEIEMNGRGSRYRKPHKYEKAGHRKLEPIIRQPIPRYVTEKSQQTRNDSEHKGTGGRMRRKSESDKYRHEDNTRMERHSLNDEELRAVSIRSEDNDDDEVNTNDDTRYSVTDYFRQYPHRSKFSQPQSSFRKQSKHDSHVQFDLDAGKKHQDYRSSETSPLRSEYLTSSNDISRSKANERSTHSTQYSSLRSVPLSQGKNQERYLSKSFSLSSPSSKNERDRNIDSRNYDQSYASRHRHSDSEELDPFTTLRPEFLSHSDKSKTSGTYSPSRSIKEHGGSHERTTVRDQHRQYQYYHHPHYRDTSLSHQKHHRSQEAKDLEASGGSERYRHPSSSSTGPECFQCSDNGRNYRAQVSGEHRRDSSSLPTPESEVFNGRSTLPTQSSPVHMSDISVSRRATRGSDDQNVTQREFFQGTELSVSLSSISEDEAALNNNSQLRSLNEDPFHCGITSLDAKIANLQKKIERTKAMFS